jgi:ADP-heptose:LPS heptosyltransferase
VKPVHLLVFRFSSLGDVAMTVPVLRLLLQQHPHLQVTMVSTAFVKPLFQNIERLHFHAADLKGSHNGISGLHRLKKELTTSTRFDAVADLHNVLRTKILRSLFSFSSIPVAAIDKGRKEKKALTRQDNKQLHPLKSTFQRYADVFANLGFSVTLDTLQGLSPKPGLPLFFDQHKNRRYIGIAPFAQYKEKTYPLEKMQQVVGMLAQQPELEVLLFGGQADKEELERMKGAYTQVHNMSGLGLEKELALIAHLHLMVSMDSANMHLASLYGVPVVSVWGGTHPFLGFMGWGQSLERAVQIDLPCRPSSVFGNKECRNRHACMEGIAPLMIFEQIMAQLNNYRS